MRSATYLTALLLTFAVGGTSQETSSANATFQKLTTLVGHWEGTAQWTGARTSKGPMNADYSLTGNGSALVENLVVDNTPIMTSVYHLDGKDLRVTHFCAAKNQPRLIASRMDPQKGEADFKFVDATNLLSPEAPHVDGLNISILSDTHLRVTFHFVGNGKESVEHIDLTRKR